MTPDIADKWMLHHDNILLFNIVIMVTRSLRDKLYSIGTYWYIQVFNKAVMLVGTYSQLKENSKSS